MEYEGVKKILRELAEREGVTYEEMYREIDDAIETAIRNSYQANNKKSNCFVEFDPM